MNDLTFASVTPNRLRRSRACLALACTDHRVQLGGSDCARISIQLYPAGTRGTTYTLVVGARGSITLSGWGCKACVYAVQSHLDDHAVTANHVNVGNVPRPRFVTRAVCDMQLELHQLRRCPEASTHPLASLARPLLRPRHVLRVLRSNAANAPCPSSPMLARSLVDRVATLFGPMPNLWLWRVEGRCHLAQQSNTTFFLPVSWFASVRCYKDMAVSSGVGKARPRTSRGTSV